MRRIQHLYIFLFKKITDVKCNNSFEKSWISFKVICFELIESRLKQSSLSKWILLIEKMIFKIFTRICQSISISINERMLFKSFQCFLVYSNQNLLLKSYISKLFMQISPSNYIWIIEVRCFNHFLESSFLRNLTPWNDWNALLRFSHIFHAAESVK